MTRAQAVTDAAARLVTAGIPPADARTEAILLLRHTTGITREELRLRPDTSLTAPEVTAFHTLVARRAAREPLAYLTGERGFYGLTFAVTPAVLIPRPETEGVVEAVTEAIRGPGCVPPFMGAEGARVLDLGLGSGAIAVAVAAQVPEARVWGTDISADAVAVARANAQRNGVAERVTFLHGDLFAPLPPELRFHVIASNPPYIAPEEIARLEPEVRDHEPRLALGTHPDPLHFYRRLAAEAPARLLTGGALIVEVGQGQADDVARLFTGIGGLAPVTIRPDLAGIGRVVIGTKPAVNR